MILCSSQGFIDGIWETNTDENHIVNYQNYLSGMIKHKMAQAIGQEIEELKQKFPISVPKTK